MTGSDRTGPDPAVAQIWARRAAELARVLPQPEEGEQLELLVFCLGREVYGFEAHHALDIRPASSITRVPRVPAYFAGVTHLRGRILSVLDLARFLGLDRQQEGEEPSPRHLLIVEQADVEFAMLVDEVLAVRSIALDKLQPAGDALPDLPGQYVRGVAHDPDLATGAGPVVLLDLPSLLADERLIIREEMI
jgi:purine-binding chemotaxis protein CheW